MLVLLHYPTIYQAPIGAWYWSALDKTALSVYVPGTDNEQIEAKTRLGGCQSESQFDSVAQKLADRTASGSAWAIATLSTATSPEQFLDTMRRVAARTA